MGIQAQTLYGAVTPTPQSAKNFWKLWSGIVLGDFADGLFRIVLPLLATNFTKSPLLVAGVAFTLYAPWLFFGLLAGVVVDRGNRKKILIEASLPRTFSLLLLLGLLLLNFGVLPALYVVAFLLG